MTAAGGDEGARLPSLSEKLKLLMKVRRRPDGSPWRGATDIRAGLLALPGGEVQVDLTVSMIAKVINGTLVNPGALLLAGLAALFEVPTDYLMPPVCDRVVDLTLRVHRELQALEVAPPAPAEEQNPAAAAADTPDWTSWARDLTLGVKQIAGRIADELELGTGQAEALLQLVGSASASFSVREMADICRFTPAYATRIADVFEDKGLLQPQHLEGDSRRIRRLALTDRAREIVDKHTQPGARAQQVLDAMSADELALAERMIAALAGRAPSAGTDGGRPVDNADPEALKARRARGVA